MHRFLLIFLIGCGCQITAFSQKKIVFSSNCVLAHDAAISLKINLAQKYIQAEKAANPDNIVPYFLEIYIDFLELFLNEDPNEFQKRKEFKKKRLSIIEKGPDTSPLKGFMISAIYLQWAAVDIKFGHNLNAGIGFRDALKTIRENQSKFPDFSPNLMISAPVNMAAATVPKGYRWLSSLVGISGNMETGIRQMNQFLKTNDEWTRIFKDEGIFYHCYLQFYLLNEPEEALKYIRVNKLDLVNKHLFTFMAANLYLNNKQSGLAKTIVRARNPSSEYLETTVWDFEMAYASLYHLDEETPFYFKRFLQNFKGDYYVKDAWHKLSFYYLIKGDMTQHKYCLNKVLKEGKKDTEADQRAYKEVSSGKIPNVILLKARMLSDGGFHKEALMQLAGKSSNDFSNATDKLEFTYRLARIYDDLGERDRALNAYKATIQAGKNSTEYFAARSALQIGLIYEKEGNKALAKNYYQICIDMENHDYENSLEQKAKAGKERVGNR